MGNWRADQSKGVRRYVWQETRGEKDPLRRDFLQRLKKHSSLLHLRVEKIGSEIHCWRPQTDEKGATYWTSSLRFVDDGWGYWTVFFRSDERRWRATAIKSLPLGKALEETAVFYNEKFF